MSTPEYEVITLDGRPEEFADKLIRSSLPKVFFDDIDLTTDSSWMQLLSMFVSRPGKASVEKDEVIRFVERNRSSIQQFLQILPVFLNAAKKTDKKASDLIEYFDKHVRHAYAGEYCKMDMVSDKLLWLIYANARFVETGKITYSEAINSLSKPENFQRISRKALLYIVKDYIEANGDAGIQKQVYLMLTGEAARMANIPEVASVALALIARSQALEAPAATLEFLDNLEPYLEPRRPIDVETRDGSARIRARFQRLSPDEF